MVMQTRLSPTGAPSNARDAGVDRFGQGHRRRDRREPSGQPL